METKILDKVRKMRSTKVHQSISNWIWFKHNVLEQKGIREWFQSFKEMDRPTFAKHLAAKCNPNKFPPWTKRSRPRKSEFISDCWCYYCSTLPSSLPYKVQQTKFGLGIWAQKEFNSSLLWGLLIWADRNTFEALKDHEFPSLYSNDEVGYVLTGPLSLVNHSCESSLGFSKEIVDEQLNELRLYIDPEVTLKKGEVLVNYCDKEELWFECKCWKYGSKYIITLLFSKLNKSLYFVVHLSSLLQTSDWKLCNNLMIEDCKRLQKQTVN